MSNHALRRGIVQETPLIIAALFIALLSGYVIFDTTLQTPTAFVAENFSTGINQPPNYIGNKSWTSQAGAQFIIDLAPLFVDPENDVLTFIVAEEDKIAVSMYGSIATLTPAIDFSGERVLTIIASDGTNIVRTLVKFVVNAEIPVIAAPNEKVFGIPVQSAIRKYALNEDVLDEANKKVGRKIADESGYETSFAFIGTQGNDFVLRLYHNATATLPVWIEGAAGTLSANIAGPNEQVNLSVPLINGKVPLFKLHVGFESEVFEFGTASSPTFGTADVVDSCVGPVTINTSTTLSQNLSANLTTGQFCIGFGANNIFLNCSGFSLNSNGTGIGINITDREGITVRDCTILNFTTGIQVREANHTLIQNTTIDRAITGINLTRTLRNTSIRDSRVNVSGTGVLGTSDIVNNFNMTLSGSHVNSSITSAISMRIQDSIIENNSLVRELLLQSTFNSTIRMTNISGGGDALQIDGANYTLENIIANSTNSNGVTITRTNSSVIRNVTGNSASGLASGIFIAGPLNHTLFFNITGTTNSSSTSSFGVRIEPTILAQFDNVTISNVIGRASAGGAIFLDNLENITIRNVTGVGVDQIFGSGIIFSAGQRNVTIENGTFMSNASTNDFGAVTFSGGVNNTLNRVRLFTNTTWVEISTNSDNRLANVTFVDPDSEVFFTGPINLSPLSDVTVAKLNLTNNRVFLNSTNLTRFNQSATVTLRNLTFVDPGPIVDREDDGTFVTCTTCTEESYSGGVFAYNVTSFTAFSSEESALTGCATINASTSLTQNLTSNGTCITLGANNIFLNCSGYTITYDAQGTGGDGIVADGRTNITIRECIIRDINESGSAGIGVNFTSTSSSIVVNNTIQTNGTNDSHGVLLTGTSAANVIENNTIISLGSSSATNHGIRLTSVSSNNITNNTISATNGQGLRLDTATGTRIFMNVITTNGTTAGNNGIFLQGSASGNSIANNTIIANGSSANHGIDIRSSSNNVVVENNTITTSGGTSRGIQLLTTVTGTNVSRNTITTTSGSSPGVLIDSSNDNKFDRNNITTIADGTYAIEVTASNGTLLNNSILTRPAQWINTGANTLNNFSNTSFVSFNGTIRISSMVQVNGTQDVTQQRLNVTFNNSFLNSTNLTFFNLSAQITLNNLAFVDPRPIADFNDDGTFDDCPASICAEVSYAGNIFVFNVTGFTSFSASETSDCSVINASTTLIKNLSSLTTCIEFGTSHIFLNCSGFTITYGANGSSNVFGVVAANKTNITVQDCIIMDNNSAGSFGIGINFTNVSRSFVHNNSIQTNGTTNNYGIYVNNGSTNNYRNNTVRTLGTGASNNGIFLENTVSSNNITNNSIQTNGTNTNIGLLIQNRGDSNVIRLNTIYAEGTTGGSNIGIRMVTLTSFSDLQYNNISATNGTGINVQNTADTNVINNNFIVTRGNSAGPAFNLIVNAVRSQVHNNTVFSPTSGISIDGSTAVNASNNNITVTAGGGIGIDILSSSGGGTATGNTFTGNRIVTNGSGGNHAIRIRGTANNPSFNKFAYNNITTFSNGSYAIHLTIANDTSFNNTLINNTVHWIFTGPNTFRTNFSNTTFEMPNGSITLFSFQLNGTNNVTQRYLNITQGAFLNSSNLTLMNVSANITLRNITFVDPQPRIDREDDATNVFCPADTCQKTSFVNNVFQLNVTSFTTFSVAEGNVNVTLTKTDAPDPVTEGGQLNYTITINVTAGNASNITLTDLYPAQVIFINSSPPNVSATNNTFIIGNLTPGNVFQVNISVLVNNGTADIVMNNTANITYRNVSGTAFFFNVTENTTVAAGAAAVFNVTNLTVTKIDAPDPVIMSTFLNYTIFVNVTGNGTAFNVTVNDTYPNQTIFLTSSPSPLTGTNNTWILGNLSIGTNFSINISLLVTNVSNNFTINNSVNASFQNETNQGYVTRNVTISTEVYVPVQTNVTNITVTKIDAPDPVIMSTFLNYTIFVNVTGNGTAYNVTVNDTYPNQTIFLASSPAALTGTNNTWILGNLTVGTNFSINVSLLTTNISNNITINNSVNASFQNETSQGYVTRNTTIRTEVYVPVQTNVTNITITKTDSPDPVLMSSFLNYTIFVNVTGNGTAFNVTVNDTYPNQTIFLASSPAPLTGTNNTWILGNLSVGTNFSINISLIPTNVTNNISINNSINVTFQNESSQTLVGRNFTINTTIFVTPPIINTTNITITKTDSPDPVNAGAQLNYTIFVNVTGNSTAFNVTVNDTYPSQVVFDSASPAPLTGTNNTFILGNLTVGTNFSINITLNVSRDLVNNTLIINNTANVTFQNESSQAFQSRVATQGTTLLAFAFNVTNISITKTDSPDPVLMSSFLNYTIFVNVTGNGTAFNVTVNDTYPNQTIFLTSEPAPLTGTNNTWILGNLTVGTNFSINISLIPTNVTNNLTINNSVNVTFQNETSQGFQSRNATINTTVFVTPPILNSTNITITKIDTPDPASAGGQLNYTIFVNVTGNGTAFNVTVNDTYPTQVVFDTSQPAPLTGTNNTWVLGNLSPGTNFSINITLNVSSTLINNTITINNTANVTFQNETSQAFQSRVATQSTTILANALNFTNITVTKTDNPDPVNASMQLNYTIVINVTGNGTAFNVTVNDTYDSETFFISSSPANSTGNNTFIIGNLTPGTVFSLNISVFVNNVTNGTILTNFVNVTFQNETGHLYNYNDSETTTVQTIPSEPASTGGIVSISPPGIIIVPPSVVPATPEIEAPKCIENWECEAWSQCTNGIRMRSCVEINNCNTTEFRPIIEWPCKKPKPTPYKPPVETPAIVKPRLPILPIIFIILGIILMIVSIIAFSRSRPRVDRRLKDTRLALKEVEHGMKELESIVKRR